MILSEIDWQSSSYDVTDSVTVDLSADSVDRLSVMKSVIRSFENESSSPHYVYCLEIEKNGEQCWYVGESANLYDRITTHIRKKNILNIQRVEELPSRQDALEREREMSYEIAIQKNTTNIYGGR